MKRSKGEQGERERNGWDYVFIKGQEKVTKVPRMLGLSNTNLECTLFVLLIIDHLSRPPFNSNHQEGIP